MKIGALPEHPFLPLDVIVYIMGMLPYSFECVWRCVCKSLYARFPLGKWNPVTAMHYFISDPSCQDLVIFAVRNWRWSVSLNGNKRGTLSAISNARCFRLIDLFARYSTEVSFNDHLRIPLEWRCEFLKVIAERHRFDVLPVRLRDSLLNDALRVGDVDTIEWLLPMDPPGFVFDREAGEVCLRNGAISVYRHYVNAGRLAPVSPHQYAYKCIEQGCIKDYYWARGIVASNGDSLSRYELGRAVLESGHIWLAERDAGILDAILAASSDVCVAANAARRENFGVLKFMLAHSTRVPMTLSFVINGINSLRTAYLLSSYGLAEVKVTRRDDMIFPNPMNTRPSIQECERMFATRKLFVMSLSYSILETVLRLDQIRVDLLEVFAHKAEPSERLDLGKTLICTAPWTLIACHKTGVLSNEDILELVDYDSGPYSLEKCGWMPSRILYEWCRDNADRLGATERHRALFQARLNYVIGGPGEIRRRGRNLDPLSTALLSQTKRIRERTAHKSPKVFV